VRTKKVNRYSCDFCGKAGLSASHMKHHEEHCTKNPGRKCGICKMLDQEPTPIADLLAILPDPSKFNRTDPFYDAPNEVMDDEAMRAALAPIFPKLREMTGGCPACIMAALRQKGIPVPVAGDLFDYQKERAAIWSDRNAEEWRREEMSAIYGQREVMFPVKRKLNA
jgi:hypothetical protein